jgi:L-lysine 2,3-aminomutase
MLTLFQKGVTVRNQSVLIRDVNDNIEDMTHLVRKLSYMNVQPYYVYQHDMVKGVEVLRTRLVESVELELAIRGTTAGYNTPLFVTDAPGGGENAICTVMTTTISPAVSVCIEVPALMKKKYTCILIPSIDCPKKAGKCGQIRPIMRG